MSKPSKPTAAKPLVVHVGPVMEICRERLSAQFCLVELTGGAMPDAATAAEARCLIAAGGAVTRQLIAALPKLGAIAAFGVGVDSIDVAAARERGIGVANAPGVTDDCVADMAMALLLAVTRDIVAGDRFVRDGRWTAGPYPLRRRTSSRRMGILGLGRIGLAIARRAAAFDMRVTYHNRRPRHDVPYAWQPTPRALAEGCDVLMLACLGGAATRKLVDADVLQALGPDGVLVNIARGSVVDEAALIDALQTGKIAAAGLDVFAHEPEVPQALRALPNVVLMPHRGGGTVETFLDCADMVVANLAAFYRGEALLTPIPDSR